MKTTPPKSERKTGAKTKPKSDWHKRRANFLRQMDPGTHFYRVFDGLPDIHFFVKDRTGHTLFCSRYLPAHHGLADEEEMLGKTNHDLTPGPLAEQYLADDAEVYRTGRELPAKLEVCLDRVGLPEWYICKKYPIKNRAGRVIGIMGTLQRYAGSVASEVRGACDPRVHKVIEVLNANLDRFPAINSLASKSHLSVRQLQRTFAEMVGMSPRTYWMKLRIRHACRLLAEGSEPISVIAERLGFADQSNLTAHFRRHTGTTPAHFRRTGRQWRNGSDGFEELPALPGDLDTPDLGRR